MLALLIVGTVYFFMKRPALTYGRSLISRPALAVALAILVARIALKLVGIRV